MKKAKKVNMVDVIAIHDEYGIAKPVEVTTRRGMKQEGE
jgi:hypothetical protein